MKKFIIIFFIVCSVTYVHAQIPAITEIGMQPKVLNLSSFSPAQNTYINNELISLTPPQFQTHPEFGRLPFNTQSDNCIELVDKRTAGSRYFVKNGTKGKTFYVQQGYENLHFKDINNNFISIDPRLRPHPSQVNTYYAPNQQMPTLLNVNTGSTSIKLSGLDLVFNLNPKVYQVNLNNDTPVFGNMNTSNTTVGDDGALTSNAWQGINRTVVFDRGSIKTNFIITSIPNLPLPNGWLAFEDEVPLPIGYKIIKDSVAGNFSTPEGFWTGDLKLIRDVDNIEMARWSAVIILDGAGMPTNQNNAAYQVKKIGNNYFIRAMVKVDWLINPGTVYPVTVDPLVSGTNTWTAGDIGFTPYSPGNGFCGSSSAFCFAGPLNVVFPGQATITNVLWSSQYIAISPTLMQHGGFRMVGPCGENPIALNSWWSCNVAFSGTCSGVNNVVPNLATCLAPSCNTTIVDFHIKNIHCNLSVPGACNVARLYTVNNSWIVTVQGETVVQPPTPLSSSGSTFCSGMCTTLTATGQWGVPPYTYLWNPGAIAGNPITVCPPPNSTTNYTCIITDLCGNTATNQVAITTQSATLPTPTIVTQMNPIAGTPCPVTVTACTDWGQNYGGGIETFTWTFSGGAVTGGGALTGSSGGPDYGGAPGSTLCIGGTSYTIVYNTTGTYTLAATIVKGANCAFGYTTISVSCPVLPIELTEYYLNYNGDVCDINWTTASEKNTEYFIVEKSLDGINYTFLEKNLAAGNSNQTKKYLVRDAQPARYQVSYYRLKQFNIGDNTPKLNLVEILNPTSGAVKHQIKVQPNPANSNIDVYLPETLMNRNVKLQVYDNAGKKVLSADLNKFSSLTAYQLNIESLVTGMYSIVIFDESGNVAKATFIKN